MNQKTTLAIGCLSAALISAPVHSEEFTGRWYVGVGGGISKLEPDPDKSMYALDETQDTSVRLIVGRDLTERLSLEMYIADLGEVTLKPKATAVNPAQDPAIGYVVGGAHLLWYFYNTDGEDGRFYRDSFSAYAKIGAGTMDNDANVNYERLEDLHLSLGLGMEGFIGQGFSWRGDFDFYDTDASQLSLSLVRRFGGVKANKAPSATVPAVLADKKLDEEMAITTGTDVSPELAEEAVAPTLDTVVAAIDEAAAADSDRDGVLDTDDRCASTEDGLAVDSRGCSFSGIIEGLYFKTGSFTLSKSAMSILDNVVLELRRFPNVALEVQAHTDNRGKAADNLRLSQRRAESVANYIVKGGIKGARIRARGFGESRPAYRNASKEGRERNRRVVFQTVEELQ